MLKRKKELNSEELVLFEELYKNRDYFKIQLIERGFFKSLVLSEKERLFKRMIDAPLTAMEEIDGIDIFYLNFLNTQIEELAKKLGVQTHKTKTHKTHK